MHTNSFGFYVVLAVAAVLWGITIALWYIVVRDVNHNLPEAERFGVFGSYFANRSKIEQAYRRIYPDGRKLMVLNLLGVFIMGFLVISGFLLGIYRLP